LIAISLPVQASEDNKKINHHLQEYGDFFIRVLESIVSGKNIASNVQAMILV